MFISKILLAALCIIFTGAHNIQAQQVGIHTRFPAGKLQINATSTSGVPILLLYDSLKANGGNHINFQKEGISNSWEIIGNTDASITNANLRFNYSGLNRIAFLAEGRVGIGTASPAAALHINTSNQIVSYINGGNNMYVTLAEEGFNNGYFGSFSGAANDIDFGTYSGNNNARLYLVAGDTARIMIDSTGWVGAGVSNPHNNFSVSRGLIVDANNQNGIGVNNNWLRFGSNSGEGIASNKNTGSSNYNGLDFYTNFQSRISILQNGNVGVGTTNPQAKLHIAGSLKVNEYRNIREKLQGVENIGNSTTDTKTIFIQLGFIPASEDLFGTDYFRQLFVTIEQENLNVTDGFIAQVGSYDNEFMRFPVKITRVDANAVGTGWGQNLKLHWMFLN